MEKIRTGKLSRLLKEFDLIDREITMLGSLIGLLEWDEGVAMPKDGAEYHAKQRAMLEVKIQEIIISKRFKKLVSDLKKKTNYNKLSPPDKRRIELYGRRIRKLSRIPKNHIEETAKLQSRLYELWVEGRKNGSAKDVLPSLKRMFELKRLEAKYIDPKKPAYDVLFDDYERDIDTQLLDRTFEKLKKELLEIYSQISKSKNYQKINSQDTSRIGNLGRSSQWELSEDLCKRILIERKYSLSSTEHPFMADLNVNDCRVTTAVRDDPMFCFLSTAHECGHALYAMNVSPEYDGTILASAMGMGLHESQSRLWENMICKSHEFWNGYYPRFLEKFPHLKNIPAAKFYELINTVRPSLIRIESDELTYCLHIIIRYEIERGIIENRIDVNDIEKIWNEKYLGYLGMMPNSPVEGVLQDVHWYTGLIGYFPTYALGNIFSASLYAKMSKENPKIKEQIQNMDFSHVKRWLRENVHKHGASRTTNQVMTDSCGKYLDIADYVNYLKDKYYGIYGIKE